MRIARLFVLMAVALGAAAPASAIILISEPVALPSGCFAGVAECVPVPAQQVPSPPPEPASGPLVSVIVGIAALALAFGRRSGLQEVVS
jgi:hypothetical protein